MKKTYGLSVSVFSLLSIVVACSSGTAQSRQDLIKEREERVPPELVDGAKDSFRLFARPKMDGGRAIPVVLEEEDVLRVFLDETRFQLSIRVPKDCFHLVSDWKNFVRPLGGVPNTVRGVGLAFEAGFPLSPSLGGSQSRNWKHFEFEDERLVASGLLDIREFTHVFSKRKISTALGEKRAVRLPLLIFDQPEGSVFARLRSASSLESPQDTQYSDFYVTFLGPQSAGHHLIHARVPAKSWGIQGEVEIRGWIRSRMLLGAYSLQIGNGKGDVVPRNWRSEGYPLLKGKRLYDKPGGRIAGIVTGQGVHFEQLAQLGKWVAVDVRHRLGSSQLWIKSN